MDGAGPNRPVRRPEIHATVYIANGRPPMTAGGLARGPGPVSPTRDSAPRRSSQAEAEHGAGVCSIDDDGGRR